MTTSTEPTNSTPNAAAWIVRDLELRGVQVVAGIPGGAILPLYDALASSPLKHVLARHEQGAGFIAQGVARVTGRAGVCLATSGPGATNLVTALADAMADSVPVVAITAQVPRALLGTNAFQEVATQQMMRPLVKASLFASEVEQVPALLAEAFERAQEGRRGPVVLDLPKDVLTSPLNAPHPIRAVANLRGGTARLSRVNSPLRSATDPNCWRDVAAQISASKRPLLYVGGGVQWARAEVALRELVHRAQLPVVCSLHGLGTFPTDDALCLGMIGMHGQPAANLATERADCVLAIGARFDDRATGDPVRFCRNARIVHIDVDAGELGKIKPIEIGIVSDAKYALEQLLKCVEPSSRSDWLRELNGLRRANPLPPASEAGGLLERVNRALPVGATVTTDVGQHQMWAAQRLRFSNPRSLLTSGGLGTMGFGLPTAIGAALARPHQKVLCISGDGSILMNLSELATLREQNLDVTVLLLNNAQLGMVRQQQEMFYGRRLSACRFDAQPDFVQIARGFGLHAERKTGGKMSASWLREALQREGPQLLEARLEGDENVLPIVPAGASNLEMCLKT